MSMTYADALRYLYSFIDYEKKTGYTYGKTEFSLERMRTLLDLLGRPQCGLRCVHIAGTKGKGSTAAMIASVLISQGLKVGLYTSPHLVTFRERIVVGEQLISKDETCVLAERLKDALAQDGLPEALRRLSFFDVWTALALLRFREENVDVAVIEVGMGGRLDSTNVVDSLVPVITPIGYDHMDKLGPDLRSIAGEKAGIIKSDRSVITARQEPEALAVVRDRAERAGARLYEVGRDVLWGQLAAAPEGQRIWVKGIARDYDSLELQLAGLHQAENAAIAIGAVELLATCGVEVSSQAIAEGLRRASWPGRFQIICRDPLLLLDGAHNGMSARALVDTIRSVFPCRSVLFVFAALAGKDVESMAREFSRVSDRVIATRVRNRRTVDPHALAAQIGRFFSSVTVARDTRSALEAAAASAGSGDIICVTGSLYLVGEALEVVSSIEPEEVLA